MKVVIEWKAAGDGASTYEVWRGTSNVVGEATRIAEGVTRNSYVDESPINGTGYYWVRAINHKGAGPFSDPIQIETGAPKLAAPRNVRATGFAIGHTVIEWDPVPNATSYDIFWGGSDTTTLTLATNVTGTSYTDNYPAAAFYRVVAKAPGFTNSDRSLAAMGFGSSPAAPNAVASIYVTTQETAWIQLMWSTPSRAQAFFVYRNTVNNFATATLISSYASATGAGYIDQSAAYDTPYWYWVVAANENGKSSATGTTWAGVRPSSSPPPPPPTPGTPTNVAASTGLAGKVTVSWSASSNASWYEVWRSTSNDVDTATLLPLGYPVYGTSFDDTDIEHEVDYYYWVRAGNSSGTSGYSTPSATGWGDVSVLAAPDYVTATDGEGDRVTVAWPAVTGATSYQIWRGPDSNSANASFLASVGTVTSYEASVTDSTVRHYFVRTVNANGTGPFGASDSGYGAVPLQVTSTAITTSDPDKVRVSWLAPQYARRFWVWRNTVNDFSTATHVQTDTADLAYDDVDAPRGVDLWYWVVPHNDVGAGPASAAIYGYRPLLVPAAPLNVSASDGLVGYTTVTWDASPGADTYEVWREPYDGGPNVRIAQGLTGTSYNDTTGVTGVLYLYTVKAVNAAGTSGFSVANIGYRFESICGLQLSGSASFDREYAFPGGRLNYTFTPGPIKDLVNIYLNGVLVDTSTCVGTTYTISLPDPSGTYSPGTVRVQVLMNCDGSFGGSWSLSFSCA